MNHPHIARVVRQYLNQSARAVPPATADRLARARRTALERQKRPAHAAILAGLGASFEFDGFTRRLAAAAAILILSAVSFSYWHGQQHIAALEEVDSAILTDELPLGALVDKGFDSWLQNSAGE